MYTVLCSKSKTLSWRRVGQYRADILGLLRGVSELLPALASDLAQLCRPSREAPGAFPAKPGKRYPSPPACHTIHF
jgi:hypothetical protein